MRSLVHESSLNDSTSLDENFDQEHHEGPTPAPTRKSILSLHDLCCSVVASSMAFESIQERDCYYLSIICTL